MTVCTHCGQEGRPEDRYCQYCGQQLPIEGEPAVAQPVYIAAYQQPESWQDSQPLAAGGAEPRAAGSPSSMPNPPSMPVASSDPIAKLLVRPMPPEEGGNPDEPEREFTLDGRDVAVGRAPSCDIVLEGDQLASRRHALLRYLDGRYSVIDLGSSNGTYVNEGEIRDATPLNDGDKIAIGTHDLIFSTAPAGPSASLAGTRASGPIPATPLTQTNPLLSAVNLATSQEAVLETPPEAPHTAEYAEEAPFAVEAVSEAELEPEEAVEVPAAADEEANAPEAPPDEPPADMDALSSEETAKMAALSASPATPFAAATSAMSDASASLPSGDLDALRAQLAKVSDALARKADQEAHDAARIRAALADVRSQIAALQSAESQGADTPEAADSGDVDQLITIARQAAEHPRHLDYLTSLSEHAGEIADALEARRPPSEDSALRAALDTLRARLDELLG
jgi:pSer/pThr/pTyr-binding forkhead associated (FHA) protein